MRFFNRTELKVLAVIFTFLILICIPNFNLSIKRARDSQRRDAFGKITTFLKDFHDKNSYYPYATEDGRIIGCNEKIVDEVVVYSPCKWNFEYANEFRYFSTGTLYQILGYLEVTDSGSEYQKIVEDRKIKCGDKTCNTGRASFRTPLDKSLEEYQNELDEKNK